MRALLILAGLSLQGALACSYVEIAVPDSTAVNGTKYVIGRTNELGHIFGSERYRIKVHPSNASGSKYGFVSFEASVPNPLDAWISADGMNEAGLSVGFQTLQESEYEAPSVFLEKDILAQALVLALLKNCADVPEVLRFLEGHRVVGPGGGLGGHWAISDASGNSIVVEYLQGKRVVWKNTPRVMTNDPPMDFHWRNLNNYVNLNPAFPHQNDILGVETDVGVVPRTVGHGFNLAGLPGDTSPPSRFVQLFYLRGYAMHTSPPKNSDDAIILASGLLNKVFIPYGTVAADKTEKLFESPEYTPFGLIKIPHERRVLVRGYRNLRWRQIDLKKLDFTQSLEWKIEDGTLGIEDITSSGTSRSTFAI